MHAMTIRGSKGSSESAHTPVESPDSLINTSYANILDGISEGPIVGLVNGAQSIYLDQTPLAGADGSFNFSGVTWEQRYGEHDQDYITGFPSVESEHAIGVELTNSQPWTQSLSNLQLSGVRLRLGASSLYQQNSDGDTNGFTVNYVIELSTDGSSYTPVITSAFTGKTTSGYQRSHRIDLPPAEEGWSVRVRRTTPDSTDSKIGDTTTIVSYTEVIDAKLQYPYTALVGLKIDASQFSNIPERAFRIRGRIIQVPSNYEPSTRTYGGTWDGTFKLAWTDCPPWIYRDIILNDRYGLGRFISSDNVDKWELYQIAQYCDALVDDGKGGREPRFTCNLYLQSRADALQVLQDMASIFRGMAYYAGSQVIASADMPSDPVYTYTNSNVIGGNFSRVGSAGSTRYSVAKVSWTDRDNFGAQRVEYVQNQQSIARYGVRETEITAFGCVSQGQAQRLGHYTLLTNQVETGTIQFSVGLDGTLARPGQIIRVADQHYAGKPIGGRVKSATLSSINADDDLTVSAGDTLVVIQPNGVAQTRIIRSVAGRVISVTKNFDAAPIAESVYAIETAEVVPETYRILTIAENFGDDKLQYDIVAVQHNASKFAAIDNGAQIVTPPTTTLPGALQALPTNVQLSTYDAVKQGLTVATMRITWDPARAAQSYNVWWKRDSGDWIYAGITYTASIEVSGIYTGTYTARVSAVGVNGNASLWAYSQPTQLQGKTGSPPALASFTTASEVFGIRLNWSFPAGAEDSLYTEVQESLVSSGSDPTQLGLISYPAVTYLKSGMAAGINRFFRARIGDRIGNTGPWTDWVLGQSSSEAGPVLSLLTGQLTESELGKHLLDRIDLIDGSGPGSVNDRLDELKADIGDLVDALEYEPSKAYAAGETVRQGQRLYTAKVAVPAGEANAPPSTNYWLDTGQVVQAANGLAAQVQKNTADISTVDDKTTVNAEQLSGVKSAINDPATGLAANANGISSLKSTVDKQGSNLTATAQRVDGLTAQITPDLTGDDGWNVGEDTVYAGTVTVQSVTVNATNAVAQRIDSINASIGQTNAALSSEQTARVSADNALSTRVDTAQAAVNGATAAVQQTSSALANTNGKLAAIWSVRMELAQSGDYYAAGFGLGLEASSSGTKSQFVVRADTFLVMNTNNQAPQSFFAITGGQTFIQSAYIQDGTITNAKIGSYISSTNYIAGQSGWILNKNGTLEINGMVAGGGRLVITNRSVRVYDANNVKRVQLGDLTE